MCGLVAQTSPSNAGVAAAEHCGAGKTVPAPSPAPPSLVSLVRTMKVLTSMRFGALPRQCGLRLGAAPRGRVTVDQPFPWCLPFLICETDE